MSQIIKAFMGVFLILFLMATATGVLGAFYQIMHAQNTHASMIDELENSDYAKGVMETCFDIAEQEEYQLQLSLYSDTEGSRICTKKTELPESTTQVSFAEVVLFYDIEIPFFEVAAKQQLFGYGR